MGADLSRVRLNPLLDYAGVELKQGAVLLDADANELVGIVDRRLRALASDVLGRATVSATTPGAFRITLAAGGGLAIGPGRLYVDGLLAENHGAALPAGRRFDPLLAEPAFTDPIGYAAQPWLPNPPALPASGRHLVYLDVWTRELTHLERPDLVEPAVNVETSSRLQTVWQVRVAPENVGAAATCVTPDADLPGWDEIIAPAAGRLTTGTFDVAPADDPCELPPTGGYRGLENQLYRVEIHDPGLPGAGATFKWSRENASVGSRVASMISAGELELVTLGRDDVLGLRTGNWVEITSEARSLAGLPGEIRKATVFEATRRIQFAPGLPADLLPASFPDTAFPAANGIVVRRWDQERKVFRTGSGGVAVQVQDLDAPGSKGVIAVPAATVTLLLENGVTIRFETSGAGGFRSGNYWVFAARTADASVELLDRAPPRGIHHHFARLAIWDVAAGSLTDCRTPWPPATGEGHDCSCTACVTPESHASGTLTIQAAVDAVAQTGGTVCLLPGQYPLREPVRLAGTRLVRIRGHGPATLLAADGTAFALSDCQGVAITDLAALSLATRPAITVANALGLALERLVLATVGDSDRRAAALSLGGVVAGARFADSAIFGDTGIVALDGTTADDQGRPDFLLTAALVIEDNAFWCPRRAMALDGTVLHLLETRIAGNSVTACRETAVSATGLGLAAASLSVSRNSLAVSGDGLRLSGDGLLVEGNSIGGGNEEGTGITFANGLARSGPACCRLLDNRIAGFQTAAITVTAPVRDLIAKLNVIESCGAGILVSDAADDAAVSIENNHLRDIGRGREDDDGIVLGISVLRGAGATIRGNTLRSIGTEAIRPAARVGILALGLGRARICGNEIVGLAPSGDFVGQALGILVALQLATFELRDNRVERDAVPTDDPSNGAWTALSAGSLGDGAVVGHLGPFSTVVTGRAPSLFLGAFRPALLAATDAPALVLGNLVVARGDTPAVRLSATDCQFSDNRVEARLNRRIAVSIRAPIVVMHGNRVIGGERSVELPAATSGTAALVGNITSADIGLPGGLGPWAALNLIV